MMEENDVETDEGLTEEEEIEGQQDSDYEPEKPIPLYRVPFKGKWKKYYDSRHFKKEWHDMYPWIAEDPQDPRAAVCRVCNKQIRAHKSVLEAHQKTKKHLQNLSGCDNIEEGEEDDEPKPKRIKIEQFEPQIAHPAGVENEHLQPVIIDNQLAYISESPMDAAHNAVTTVIDGLVDQYHKNRLENLHTQNEMKMQVQAQRAALTEARNQQKYELSIQTQMYKQQELDFKLSLMRHQQETRLAGVKKEWDLKLKAVEQQLIHSRHLYEKKMKLLDEQLQFMK